MLFWFQSCFFNYARAKSILEAAYFYELRKLARCVVADSSLILFVVLGKMSFGGRVI